MSRIFDALNRTDGGYEALLQPLQESGSESFISSSPTATTGNSLGNASINGPEPMHVIDRIRLVNLRIPRSLPVLPFDGVNDLASEEYRKIRTKILHHPSQPKVFLVSRPCPGDGKTVTAVNLGGALALKRSADVLVIDADFARGSLQTIAGLPDSPGLGEVLTGQTVLDDALMRAEQLPRLHFLLAGNPAVNPAELLDSEAWLKLMDKLRMRFGYIVLDSPPVEVVPYYARLLAAADSMVLVARPDHTSRAAMNDALRNTPESKLLGVVLNCSEPWILYRKDYGGYGQYYAKA